MLIKWNKDYETGRVLIDSTLISKYYVFKTLGDASLMWIHESVARDNLLSNKNFEIHMRF